MVLAALRASLGHPEPFTLRFVEIGNEVSTRPCPLSWLALALAPPRDQISPPKRHANSLSTTGFHQQLSLLNVSSASQIIILPVDSDHVFADRYASYRWNAFFSALSAEFPDIRESLHFSSR